MKTALQHAQRRTSWPRMPMSWVDKNSPLSEVRVPEHWEYHNTPPAKHQYLTNHTFRELWQLMQLHSDHHNKFDDLQTHLDACRDRRKLFRGGPPSPFQLDGHPPFDHEFRADGKYRVLPFVGREVLHEDYLDAKKQVTAIGTAQKGLTNQHNEGGCSSVSHALPLRGLVFDVEQRHVFRHDRRCEYRLDRARDNSLEASSRSETLQNPTVLEQRLMHLGAVRYGVTATTSNLPHPSHSGLAVAGPCGGAALSVACGLSSFSCTSSDCRLAAGLLGLSSCNFGAKLTAFGLPRAQNAQGLVARHATDIIDLCECVMPTSGRQDGPPPQCKVLALDEFHGPSMDTETNCVPGTCDSVTPFSTVHPVVKKWFDGVRTALAGRLNLVHHSDTCTSPPAISDVSRQFFIKGASSDVSTLGTRLPRLKGEELIPEHDDVLGPGGPNAEALRKNGIRFVLSPLLRVPYLTSIPSQQTDIGACVDPTFNPYCILANLWGTASITIPVPLCTRPEEVCGDTENLPPLPFALLVTAVPQLEKSERSRSEEELLLKELLAVTEVVANELRWTAAPPLYVKELWEGARHENDRAASYPPWMQLL